MRYVVVIERAAAYYSAYVPDLPGSAATGVTLANVEAGIRTAVHFHTEGLKQDSEPVPEPITISEYLEA